MRYLYFFSGDLNYRITEFDAAEVKEIIRESKLEELLSADQFRQQRNQRKVYKNLVKWQQDFKNPFKWQQDF